MRTSPRPLRTTAGLLTAVLAAALSALLVTGTVAPAGASPAPVSRKISIAANNETGLVRGSVILSGTVSRTPKGSVLRFERLSGRKWVAVRTARTRSATGTYAARVTLPPNAGTSSYRVTVGAAGSLRAAVSRTVKVAALNPVNLELGALPSLVAAGGRTTLFGTVQPYVAGTTVSLQRQVAPTRWATVATVPITSSGEFSKGVPITAAGTYRATLPRIGLNSASTSRTITVRTTPVIATTGLPDGYVGTAYDHSLTTIGDPAGTWTATPLPAGIVLDASTGRLSGTPTTNGDTTVQVGFTEAGTGLTAPSRSLTLNVSTPADPTITTTALPAGTRLSSYTVTLAAAGDPAGAWTATPLPAGLSLNPTTGVISGTPTAVGDTSVVISFRRTHPVGSARTTLVLRVNQAASPSITTPSLPDGGYGAAYSIHLEAAGDPVGTWTATGLPAGLTLDAASGVISGTPTDSGSFSLSIGFTEQRTGLSDAKTITLKVNALPVISTTSLAKGVTTRAYTEQLRADGNPAGTWTVGSLPAGLNLNRTTGVIDGVPTTAGTLQVTITFTEASTGLSATRTLPLVVNQPPDIATNFLPDGGIGNFYSFALQAAGNPQGTWAASTLPAGLSLNPTTGTISGTPTASGATPVNVTFTQTSTGVSTTKALNLWVNPRPVIETGTLPNGKAGTPYKNSDGSEVTLRAVNAGNGVSGTWNVSGLPAGLGYDPQTGVISGTPDSIGSPLFVPPKKFTVTLNFIQGSTGVAALQKSVDVTISPSF